MLMTMICAALTVIGFIMGQVENCHNCALNFNLISITSQVGEGQLHWGDFDASPTLQYTSAFFTGVYGMWNIYVFLLLSLYAPSHKQYGPNESG